MFPEPGLGGKTPCLSPNYQSLPLDPGQLFQDSSQIPAWTVFANSQSQSRDLLDSWYWRPPSTRHLPALGCWLLSPGWGRHPTPAAASSRPGTCWLARGPRALIVLTAVEKFWASADLSVLPGYAVAVPLTRIPQRHCRGNCSAPACGLSPWPFSPGWISLLPFLSPLFLPPSLPLSFSTLLTWFS